MYKKLYVWYFLLGLICFWQFLRPLEPGEEWFRIFAAFFLILRAAAFFLVWKNRENFCLMLRKGHVWKREIEAESMENTLLWMYVIAEGTWLGCIFPQMFSLFRPLERFVFLMHFTMALSFALDAQSGILSALPKGKRMFGFPVVSMLLIAALTVRNFEAKTAPLPDAAVLLLALMYFEMGAGILIRLHENRAQ